MHKLRAIATADSTLRWVKHLVHTAQFCSAEGLWQLSRTTVSWISRPVEGGPLQQPRRKASWERMWPKTTLPTHTGGEKTIESILNMETKAMQYCRHSVNLRSPACSFSISNRGPRAAGGCSSDGLQLKPQAPTVEIKINHQPLLKANSTSVLCPLTFERGVSSAPMVTITTSITHKLAN